MSGLLRTMSSQAEAALFGGGCPFCEFLAKHQVEPAKALPQHNILTALYAELLAHQRTKLLRTTRNTLTSSTPTRDYGTTGRPNGWPVATRGVKANPVIELA